MKIPILILCLCTTTLALFAQKPRIENIGDRQIHTFPYKKGGDSLSFTILRKIDTVLQTTYYRNGKIESQKWKNDSTYTFDALGRLTNKRFIWDDQVYQNNKTISFYPNGQPESSIEYKNGTRLNVNYDQNGRVLMSSLSPNLAESSNTYRSMTDRNGVPIKTDKRVNDKDRNRMLDIYYDTIFYETGRPFSTKIIQSNSTILGKKKYSRNGKLMSSISSDSQSLKAFKDNINCAYGLVNMRGDTIVQAIYSKIEPFGNDNWAVSNGNEVRLLDKNGQPKESTVFPVSTISPIIEYDLGNMNEVNDKQNIDIETRNSMIMNEFAHWVFKKNGKHGVMDSEGEVILKPQDFRIEAVNPDASLFKFSFTHIEKPSKTGFLNKAGVPIFPERFTRVLLSFTKNYFILSSEENYDPFASRQFRDWENSQNGRIPLHYRNFNNNLGLGTLDGIVILEPEFCGISPTLNPSFFIASRLNQDKKNDKDFIEDGIYDIRRKKWMLDTTGYYLHNRFGNQCAYFAVEHLTTHKFGIMDTLGRFIFSPRFDSLAIVDDVKGLFWVKKGNKYQLVALKQGKLRLNKPKYDFLSTVRFAIPNSLSQESVHYFLAKLNNKWGLVDKYDNIIKPFEYDYVSEFNDSEGIFYMVKNGQASRFTPKSLPNDEPIELYNQYRARGQAYNTYVLADKPNRFFAFNDTGKIIVPPLYERVDNERHWLYTNRVIVTDTTDNKKIIFLETGKVVDFNYNVSVVYAHPRKPFIVVTDANGSKFGIVSMARYLVSPCVNYNIALCETEDSIFFTQPLNPTPNGFSRIDEPYLYDSLTILNQGWFMHDIDGKQLNKNPLRFPIDFRQGVGIGATGDFFNLYKTDCSILIPFLTSEKEAKKGQNTEGSPKNFQNIRRDKETGFYLLFTNMGLSQSVILTKKDGQILVENGRYDGISPFFDAYALVSLAGKIGLIDTLGQEIIAPVDLRTYKGNLLDSLNAPNESMWQSRRNGDVEKKYYGKKEVTQPINFFDYQRSAYSLDTTKLSKTQRNILWNLLLEKSLDRIINRAGDFEIPPVSFKPMSDNLDRYRNDDYLITKVLRSAYSDKTMSFVLLKHAGRFKNSPIFYNFYLKNNRWTDLHINDLLMIQGEKRWLFNDLIIQKVKTLKDVSIDCSNTTAFITKVENNWLLTPNGIDFSIGKDVYDRDFVVITFTWSELSPFLKLRIY